MVMTVLSQESYRGFSAPFSTPDRIRAGAQPSFVGRVLWPGQDQPSEVFVKLYEHDSCGVANEVVGYVANRIHAIRQPAAAAILILPRNLLPDLGVELAAYVQPDTDLALCWAASFERAAKPFRYLRRLGTFTANQLKAFIKSDFARKLAIVDSVTGNCDRHDANILVLDDLQYMAIDQGCVGGGKYWTTTWLDQNPANQLLDLVRTELGSTEFSSWRSRAILTAEAMGPKWNEGVAELRDAVAGLLSDDDTDAIVNYVLGRSWPTHFATSCRMLL
jgi:hypothetical protein